MLVVNRYDICKCFRYICKRKDSISDPLFESPECEDRNHVTMLLPDAPRAPTRKKTRLTNKRVSFQSDVEIMRTASSKSLDRMAATPVRDEPRPRSKSFDSFFDPAALGPGVEYLKKRRTSSLEHLAVEDVQNAAGLLAKLRRDTLGDALDFQAYKRPLVLPKPEQPLIEEESDASVDEEEEVTPSKLAAKLRRDTLGDALLLRNKLDDEDDTPTASSTEDLEETVKHSRLCMKLRRDTFGDALRQAVHCKACSSLEDITELEVPLPATPEESEADLAEETNITVEPTERIVIITDGNVTDDSKKQKSILKSEPPCLKCKTCLQLEVDSTESDRCVVCSSNENIAEEVESNINVDLTPDKIDFSNRNRIDKVEKERTRYPKKHITFTDAEISQTLEKIRTTGKIEPKEPYNLVYSSCIKGPFASSKESLDKDGSSKSSSSDSLAVSILNKSDLLNSTDKNRNHLVA